MAIQLVINKEWGLGKNENPNQGSFIIDELTDLVEEAVLKEFEAIAERGGVLGRWRLATSAARSRKSRWPTSTASTTLLPHRRGPTPSVIPQSRRGRSRFSEGRSSRSTEDEKQSQLKRLGEFHRHHEKSHARCSNGSSRQ